MLTEAPGNYKSSPVSPKRRHGVRNRRGAFYTTCMASLILPFFFALSDTILQAALSFYNQQKINYVAHDVIEHFESVQQIDTRSFENLFLKLAAVNCLQLTDVKSIFTPSTSSSEQAIEITVSGRCQNALGLFSWYRPFRQTYKIEIARFESLGYTAINVYPFCEPEAARGLSAYLPIYRPTAALPIWQFNQDNAIGSCRKSKSDLNSPDDHKPANWQQVSADLLSIY